MRLSLKGQHLAVPENVVRGPMVRLAGLLTLVGQPQVSVPVWFAFRSLFANKKVLPRWSQAIDAIPPTPAAMQNIVAAVQAYSRQFVGSPIYLQNYNLETVVKVMVELHDPHLHVQRCAQQGMNKVAQIFHPNTIKFTQATLRGVYGQTADPEYRKQALARVRTISE
jgi:hypothetical protein